MIDVAGIRSRPTPPAARLHAEWRCRCGRYLGRFVNGVLHEPNGDKSGLPVVRKCEKCGKFNRRLTATD